MISQAAIAIDPVQESPRDLEPADLKGSSRADSEGLQETLVGGAASLGRRASLEGGLERGLERAEESGGVSAEGSEDALERPGSGQVQSGRTFRTSASPAESAHGCVLG